MEKVTPQVIPQTFRSIPRWWLPYIVFFVSLLLTFLTAGLLWLSFRETHALRFQSDTSKFQSMLIARMNAYDALLHSTSSMMAINPELDKASFYTYVEGLNLHDNYPAIQGIGYSVPVPAGQEASLLARMQSEGFTQFKLWPEEAHPERHAIIYLEPLDERNQRAIGYDMYSEPVRREAMQRARDTGKLAATSRVTLVQEAGNDPQPGFLMYMPVYRMVDGKIPTTIEGRRQALLGFAYMPFRTADFINKVLLRSSNVPIDIQIYDGDSTAETQRIYQNNPDPFVNSSFRQVDSLHFGGKQWTIVYSTPYSYEQSSRLRSVIALLIGLSFSTALFLFSRSQVYARQQAESAVQARDSFLWIASHELRSPLTALLGNAQLLEMRTARTQSLSAGEQNNLQAVIQQGQRMNRMIGVLLDHSQIQTGELKMTRTTLDMVALTRRVVQEIQANLEYHALNLETAEQLFIDADETRIEQVLHNLISNAIKYSPKGGGVLVRLFQEDGSAVLQVNDQGMGIPEKDQKRIFGEFYRASNVRDAQIKGSGLGLYVIHKIIRQHNGTISLQSELGKGSTFTVRLPLAKDE